MEPESVFIITEVFNPEEFLINDIAEKWMSEGKQVNVLTRNPAYPFGKIYKGYANKFYSKKIENGITVYRYHIIRNYKDSKYRKMANYIWNTILATTLTLLFHRKNKNIFIYHTGPLTVALPGILLKKLNRGQVTIWTQDVWPDVAFAYGLKNSKFNVWFIEKFVNFIYKNCNRIITTSKPIQQDIYKRVSEMPEFIPNWPMKVFENGVSVKSTTEHPKLTFAFAGNIGVMQNLDNIILAFHQWAGNRNDVEFNIYGDGSAWSDLQTLIMESEIKNVHLKGRVPVEKIPAIYQESDVLIISLRKDAVLEKYVPAKFSTYLSAGKPIFGILSGAVQDYLQQYNLGYVASPHDLIEIGKGFEFFTKLSVEEKIQIKERAINLYKSEFDSDTNMKKLTSIVFK